MTTTGDEPLAPDNTGLGKILLVVDGTPCVMIFIPAETHKKNMSNSGGSHNDRQHSQIPSVPTKIEVGLVKSRQTRTAPFGKKATCTICRTELVARVGPPSPAPRPGPRGAARALYLLPA